MTDYKLGNVKFGLDKTMVRKLAPSWFKGLVVSNVIHSLILNEVEGIKSKESFTRKVSG